MKHLPAFIAIALTVTTLTHSQPSRAAIGVCLVNPATILGGIAMIAVGAPVLIWGEDLAPSSDALPGVGGLLTLLGAIVLDGEQGQEFKFTELSRSEARKLGVLEGDRLIYNAELDQVNMVLSEVTEELSEIKKPSATDSQKVWASYKDMVSRESFTVMTKIATQSKK